MALAKKAEEEKRRQSRMAAEGEYEKTVLVTNRNRDDSIIEASTVDDAIASLAISDSLPPDRHPEKRLRAAFKVFLSSFLLAVLFITLMIKSLRLMLNADCIS